MPLNKETKPYVNVKQYFLIHLTMLLRLPLIIIMIYGHSNSSEKPSADDDVKNSLKNNVDVAY